MATGVAIRAGGQYHGIASGPRTAIVGDSITGLQLNTGTLHVALSDAYRFTCRFASGRSIRDLTPYYNTIVGYPDGAPSRVVLNVGTNDMGQSNANWQTDYDLLWSLVSAKTRVVLVTLSENNSIGTDINAYIANKASGNANVRVFDWKAYQDAHPGDVLKFDSVHPTLLGCQVLSAGIRTALDAA